MNKISKVEKILINNRNRLNSIPILDFKEVNSWHRETKLIYSTEWKEFNSSTAVEENIAFKNVEESILKRLDVRFIFRPNIEGENNLLNENGEVVWEYSANFVYIYSKNINGYYLVVGISGLYQDFTDWETTNILQNLYSMNIYLLGL